MSELEMLVDMGFSREKAYVLGKSKIVVRILAFRTIYRSTRSKMYSIGYFLKGKKHCNSPATEALNRLWNGC